MTPQERMKEVIENRDRKLKMQIGDLVMNNANLIAELEMLQREIQELKKD